MKKQTQSQKKNKKKKRNEMTFIKKYTIMVVIILALLFSFYWIFVIDNTSSQPINVINEDSLIKFIDSQIDMCADTLQFDSLLTKIDTIPLRRP